MAAKQNAIVYIMNDGIRTILGDPLPLPYKPNPSGSRSRDTNITTGAISDKWGTIVSETLYHKPDSKLNDDTFIKPEFIKLKSRPGPIRRETITQTQSNGNTDFVSENSRSDLIESIEYKIHNLKQLIELNELNPNDLIVLQDIQHNLNQTIDHLKSSNHQLEPNPSETDVNTHHDSLLMELEHLKQLSKHNEQQHTKKSDIKPFNSMSISPHNFQVKWIVIGIIVFLLSSYIVSDWKYEYCYYFC